MIRQAVDLIDAFRRRALSPVEATHEALEAIDRFDDQVNAFVLVDAEGALAGGASPAEAIGVELANASDNGRNGFKIDLVRRLVPAAIAEARANGRGA